jgi:uncharacterized protein
MNNPFKYGELSAGSDFCNRKNELKRLHQAFTDGQNLVLISPRRWGKSSLVDEAIIRYKGKLKCVKLDCFGMRSSEEFYAELLSQVLKSSNSKFQELANIAKKYLTAIVPYISYSTDSMEEIKISLNLPKKKSDLSTTLNLAQNLAQEEKARYLICIDEFQKINDWPDGKETLEKLRSYWQRHKEVTYCLYGSKRNVMANMFGKSSQPFYRFGEAIFLEKISRKEWVDFIIERCTKTGRKIKEPEAVRIAHLAECHSYYVQYLARLCWNNSDKQITDDIVTQSYSELLNDHIGIFRKLTDRLTRYQVNYLRAFCHHETKFTSRRVLETYQLGSPGNIRRIEKVMSDLEIIDYFIETPTFSDPWFKPLFEKFFRLNALEG